MRKIISILLALSLFLSLSLTAFAAFIDFDDSHWAASYVNALVAEGTINGFEDGSFRPAGTVTRAEFVKMIGNGSTRFEKDFDDVPSSHWAYEYIMTSGLDPVYDNTFMPSQPITRGEVAVLLWKRAGSPAGVTVPPIIHRQGTNYDAISWVYSNSIMTGDDNIDLRLSDTLTRAEAAALIIRSRSVGASTQKTNFFTAVDPKVLETAYNSFKLVDKAYDENATLTNGELAMAAARIISEQDNPDYPGVSATISFDHKYAQPLNMLTRYYLGEENDNAEYIEKKATVKDSILALMFATRRSGRAYIPCDADGACYEGATFANKESENLLKAAYQNGITLSADMSMDLDKEITLKELACLMLEFDGFSGLYSLDTFSGTTSAKDTKMDTNISKYPFNSADYRIIFKGIPSKVYETPFIDALNAPVAAYNITNPFDGIFNGIFTQWYANAKSKGVEISIMSSPVLSASCSTGYSFRVNLKVVDAGDATKLADIIKCADETIGSVAIADGTELWLDVNTGKPFNDVTFPFENVFVNQII